MKPNALDDAPLSGFHKRLAIYAAGGPFLDGYILSGIGVALVALSPELGVSSFMEGMLGAGALIGMLFGGAISGFLTDRFGRQVMYTLDLGLISVFSVLQFFVTEAWMLLVLRILLGAVVAADYPMASSLLTEFTPHRYRGPLLSMLVCMFFVGAAASYFVGDALVNSGPNGWRWFLLSSAIPASSCSYCAWAHQNRRDGCSAGAVSLTHRLSCSRSTVPGCRLVTSWSRAAARRGPATFCAVATSAEWRSLSSSTPVRTSQSSPSTPSGRKSRCARLG